MVDAPLEPVAIPLNEDADRPSEIAPQVKPTEEAPWEQRVRNYVVEPGDSVRTIARQFGITNETLIWANELDDPDLLQVGQKLTVLPFSGLIHEVRPGDTLASVANSYDARIADVIQANSLKEPFIIVVGQSLMVPGGYRPLPAKIVVPAPAPAAPPSRDPSTAVAEGSSGEQRTAAIKAPIRKIPVLGNTPQEQFIASIGEAAMVSLERTGVPASVTIAQAILESYWGSSRLSRDANNYFGIKAQTREGSAGVVWYDVWEVIGGRNVFQREPFRAYNTIADSFADHGRFFLENGRYAAAMAARNDAKQFAREINRAGYATDPAYASKLIALMDKYDLYRFDQ